MSPKRPESRTVGGPEQRARAAGESIQAYMKQAVERLAREPDDDVLFADLDQFVAAHGTPLDVEAMLDDIDNQRP